MKELMGSKGAQRSEHWKSAHKDPATTHVHLYNWTDEVKELKVLAHADRSTTGCPDITRINPLKSLF
ncbi:hypothetical protein EL84_22970 [Paenibacillus sp. VT-400]|nr:hypothetical protein EL84_22970 [Paenibacillus sp. VT-400]